MTKNKKNLGLETWDLKFPRRRRGMYLPVVLLACSVFMAFAMAIVTIAMSNVKIANLHNTQVTSLSVAEAGINYYMWHLSHNNTDYCDGVTPCPAPNADGSYGPFTHNFTDISGQSLGSYDLFITPPSGTSSITTVKSVGKNNGKILTKTILSQIGMPSYTKYTLLVNNSELWVGSGEKINGSIFVNHNGLKNDGEISKDVSSTEATYTSGMFGGVHPAIWGSGTFGGSQITSASPINFNQLNVDMLTIRNETLGNGEGYFNTAGSGLVGYHVILSANNYEVRTVKKYDNAGLDIIKENSGTTYNYPSAGVLFFEDNVWVEGTINNRKVTIIAADPEANQGQKKRIIIPNNIKYTTKDGNDKIGLITQTNITVSHNAPTDMEIDAAMIAQSGYISICPGILSPPYTTCSTHPQGYLRHKITVYGSMAHNTGLVWTINWGGGHLSGYSETETIIDQHNVLNPPPKFPLIGSYAILSWREE